MENHWIYYEELKKISVGKPLNILWREKHWIKKISSVGKPLNILWRDKKRYQLESHWIYYEELKKISVGKPLNILWRVKKDICWKPLNILWRVKKDICWKTTEYIMKR